MQWSPSIMINFFQIRFILDENVRDPCVTWKKSDKKPCWSLIFEDFKSPVKAATINGVWPRLFLVLTSALFRIRAVTTFSSPVNKTKTIRLCNISILFMVTFTNSNQQWVLNNVKCAARDSRQRGLAFSNIVFHRCAYDKIANSKGIITTTSKYSATLIEKL